MHLFHVSLMENTCTCTICYDELFTQGVGGTGKDCVPLSCGHCYHRDCITTWLSQKAECPSCKYVCRSGTTFQAIKPMSVAFVNDKRSLPELEEALLDAQARLQFVDERMPEATRELGIRLKQYDESRGKQEKLDADISEMSSRAVELSMVHEELTSVIVKLKKSDTHAEKRFPDGSQVEATEMHRSKAARTVPRGDVAIREQWKINVKLGVSYSRSIRHDSRGIDSLEKSVNDKAKRSKLLREQYDRMKDAEAKKSASKTAATIPSMFAPRSGLTNSEQTALKMSTERKHVLCRFNSNAQDSNLDSLSKDVVVIAPSENRPPRQSSGRLSELIRQASVIDLE